MPRSSREESNLRRPAPKAGALAIRHRLDNPLCTGEPILGFGPSGDGFRRPGRFQRQASVQRWGLRSLPQSETSCASTYRLRSVPLVAARRFERPLDRHSTCFLCRLGYVAMQIQHSRSRPKPHVPHVGHHVTGSIPVNASRRPCVTNGRCASTPRGAAGTYDCRCQSAPKDRTLDPLLRGWLLLSQPSAQEPTPGIEPGHPVYETGALTIDAMTAGVCTASGLFVT